MARKRKTPPPQKANVEAVWWRDPYADQRTTKEGPLTWAYCTIGIVWKETAFYIVMAREVNAQSEFYLSERDDQKIYKTLIYRREVIGTVTPHDPIDDDDEEDERNETLRPSEVLPTDTGGGGPAQPQES